MLGTLVRGAEPRFHAWQIPRACPKVRYVRGLMGFVPAEDGRQVPFLGPSPALSAPPVLGGPPDWPYCTAPAQRIDQQRLQLINTRYNASSHIETEYTIVYCGNI